MTEGSERASILASIAAIAALVATGGDFLLLWVDGGGDRDWLAAGHYLGVLCIPLYAVGYHVVARMLAVRAIFWIGLYASALGTAIHAMTAIAILQSPAAAVGADRFAALAPVLPYLVPLWGLVGVLTVVGSVLQFRAVRVRARYPRWFAWTTPLTLVLLVAAIGALFGSLAQYLVPAAPNVAHVFYFGAVIGASSSSN